MKAFDLRNYLDTYNSWQKIFDKDHKTINIGNMTQKDVDMLAGRIDSEMSPENLSCDGELTGGQVRAKADYYMDVWAELKDVCRQKGFKIPKVWELEY